MQIVEKYKQKLIQKMQHLNNKNQTHVTNSKTQTPITTEHSQRQAKPDDSLNKVSYLLMLKCLEVHSIHLGTSHSDVTQPAMKLLLACVIVVLYMMLSGSFLWMVFAWVEKNKEKIFLITFTIIVVEVN